MSDKEIIALYKSGQQEKAFRVIVDTYSERLYWHVRHFLCSHEDADDLLQDIFLKIWNSLPGFRGEAKLYTWMFRIASNEALNFLGKQRVRAAIQSDALPLESAREVGADPFFNGDEAQGFLVRAISELPEKQRLVFIMRYLEEMPYEEIAEILNTSVGALKASYHFAVNKIRKKLKKNNS